MPADRQHCEEWNKSNLSWEFLQALHSGSAGRQGRYSVRRDTTCQRVLMFTVVSWAYYGGVMGLLHRRGAGEKDRSPTIVLRRVPTERTI
jgi:hypothetical protein